MSMQYSLFLQLQLMLLYFVSYFLQNSKMNRAPSIISIHHACSCKDKESSRTPRKVRLMSSSEVKNLI
jgi:hypothetical protein